MEGKFSIEIHGDKAVVKEVSRILGEHLSLEFQTWYNGDEYYTVARAKLVEYDFGLEIRSN